MVVMKMAVFIKIIICIIECGTPYYKYMSGRNLEDEKYSL
jgi:hypothetical protein